MCDLLLRNDSRYQDYNFDSERNYYMKKNFNLRASIHTLSIRFHGLTQKVEKSFENCVYTSYNPNKDLTTYRINANKLYGDIFKFSDFKSVLTAIIKQTGNIDYQINRFDIRFDSYDKTHYKQFWKLYRMLISLIGTTYSTQKNYCSSEIFTDEKLSLSIRNNYFQIEYYDKEQQSKGLDKAKSRFELRSLKQSLDIENLSEAFFDTWKMRFEKSLEHFDEMQMRYNNELERIYKVDRYAFPRKYASLNAFLAQHQDCIYTKLQMIDLLKRFDEVKNPENRAKNFKQNYGIEYCTITDIKCFFDEILRAATDYFQS